MHPPLTPDILVAAYARGIFPMGLSARSWTLRWLEPELRGVIPLDGFHVARSLARLRRRGAFRFSCDQAFAAVLDGCAARPETWINPPIRRVFLDLHASGLAHSIEVWDEGGLAGGVYGLALGGAFCAESMFSARTGGSKLALGELVARLTLGGYRLLDTQYLTPHLASLGGVEVPRDAYRRLLAQALASPARPDLAFAPRNADALDGAFWAA